MSRKEIETYNDIELNEFCNRILWLFDNYVPNWGVEELVKIDVLSCYVHVSSRLNFTRKNTITSNKPPNIMVKGEVLYNKNTSIWREGQLLSMSPTQLNMHCNKTSKLLMEYKNVWETFDEMVWDANFCSVEMLKINSLYEEKFSDNLSRLPPKIAKDFIEENIKTCSVVGVLVKENWRLGHDFEDLLVSLRSCFWKITPFVLCIGSDNSIDMEQMDSLLLTSSAYSKFNSVINWKSVTTLTAEEVSDFCLVTVARINYFTMKKVKLKGSFKEYKCVSIILNTKTLQ